MADRLVEIENEIRALEKEKRGLIRSRQREVAAQQIAAMTGRAWDNLPESMKDKFRHAAAKVDEAGGNLPVVGLILDEVDRRDLRPDNSPG